MSVISANTRSLLTVNDTTNIIFMSYCAHLFISIDYSALRSISNQNFLFITHCQ